MKLLVLTQKIDINDDILGFMHRWVAEFARRCEKITVIALGTGRYDLPANVKVLSLGKEAGASKLKYLARFYSYVWRERKNYDAVFVHMNQEYVVLGGWFWQLLGKKVTLWRNHQAGGFWVRIAVFFSDTVFCTSKFAFIARYKKNKIMPVGIDTEFFRSEAAVKKTPRSILFFGRVSPIKHPEILVDALNILQKEGIDFTAGIVGGAPERDKTFAADLKDRIIKYGLSGKITMAKAAPYVQAPQIFNQYEIFVNLTPAGSLDKTILEALACGLPVLMSNNSLSAELPAELFFDGTAEDLAAKLKLRLERSVPPPTQFREYVVSRHSLAVLADKLFAILK